jgi:ribosomal protein S18 acetylase RimI-like enzyme
MLWEDVTMCLEIKQALKKDKDDFIQLALNLTSYNIERSENGCPNGFTIEDYLDVREKNAAEIFDSSIESGNPYILLASIDGKSAGYLLAYIYNKLGFIDEIYVEDSVRRLGLGNSLLAQTMEWMKERKVERMSMNVFNWNTDAIQFSQNTGFEAYKICYMKDLPA